MAGSISLATGAAARLPLFLHRAKWRVHAAIVVRDEDLPPSSREEAIRDARMSMWSVIQKSPRPQQQKRRGQYRSHRQRRQQQQQARLVIEMPLLDESKQALASLLVELLEQQDETISFKPCVVLASSGVRELILDRIGITHQITSLEDAESCEVDPDCDFVVVLAPDSSQLSAIESIAASSGGRPLVVVNPQWEPSSSAFCKSFEVAYSFTPLSIQGLLFLSKLEGAILRRMPASPWRIFTKEGDGRYRCVSSAQNRPSQEDLQDVLYESVASSSPIVKSLNFLKNITGRT